MPNWATNVMAARYVYTNMGSPKPPKELSELGKIVTTGKKMKADGTNSRLYNVSSGSLPRLELNAIVPFTSLCQVC